MRYLAHHAPAVNRRSFLKLSGAGLALGLIGPLSGAETASAQAATDLATPFLSISPAGIVTVISKHVEFGQGSATGLATLVAEELDADWDQVRVGFAPADAGTYANAMFGVQGTGGSTAMANSWDQYRQAGAVARAMLINAAAEDWGVPAAEITIAKGVVSHGDRTATFAELAAAAGAQPVPAMDSVSLKTPDQWTLIGQQTHRIDSQLKTSGAVGAFALDQRPEGRIVATLLKAPAFGGTLVGFEIGEAATVKGFIDAFQVGDAVAVLAQSTWPALKAKGLIQAEWDLADAETRSTEQLVAAHRASLEDEGLVARDQGDAAAALASAAQVVEADFTFPYLAHAPMETLNATIQLTDDGATIWAGSQIQTVDQMVAASVLGINPANLAIHTTWAGGSFGRRATPDAHLMAEAASIAKAYAERTGNRPPIQLVYSREDDITGGYYRPMYAHRVRVGLDADGQITGWHHKVAGQSIFTGTAFAAMMVHNGIDHSTVEGIADTTYQLPAMRTEVVTISSKVPGLWWRSVGHTHTAYAMEVMMDQAAKAAGADPIAYRIAHYPEGSREAGVLRALQDQTGGVDAAPEGRFRGVACHKSFNTYVAEMVEVSQGEDGLLTLHKVWCAVDCGIAVNPDMVRAQMEGAIGYGLGAILRNKVRWDEGGQPLDVNFDTYTPLRISDMPEIAVHIVASDVSPTGVGEPGLPPLGPALANAWFAATGTLITDLPFSDHGIVA